MKRKLFFALIALFAIGLVVVGCSNGDTSPPYIPPAQPFTPPTDWVGFSDAEMLAAGFYAGDGVAEPDRGSITKNPDGTFEVTVKTVTTTDARASVVWFTFADEGGDPRVIFRNGWSALLTLPTNAQYKPVKVQVVPSTGDNGGSPTGWAMSQDTDVTGDIDATFDDDGNVIGLASFHWGTEEVMADNLKTIAIWVFWPPVGVPEGEEYTFIINDIKVKPHDTSTGDPDLEAWTPDPVTEDVSGWTDFPVDKVNTTFYPANGASIVDKVGGGYTVTVKTRDPTDGAYSRITFKGTDNFPFKGGYYLSTTLPPQTLTSTTKPRQIATVAGSTWSSELIITEPFTWIEGQVDAYYAHADFGDHTTLVFDIYWHSDVTPGEDYVFTINSFKVAEEGSPPVETPVIHDSSVLNDAVYAKDATPTNLKVVPAWTANSSTYTYQWYSNATNSNTSGDVIGGQTADTFTPPTDTEGVVYYYCVVTYPTEGTSVTTRAVKITVGAGGGDPDLGNFFSLADITSWPAGVSIDGDQVTILTPASADWEGKLTYQVVFKKAGTTFLDGYSLSVTLPATGPTVTNIGTVAMASGAEPDSYASQVAEADPTGTVNLSWNGTKWNGDPTETARDQITLTITFEDGTAGGQSYTFTLNDVSVAGVVGGTSDLGNFFSLADITSWPAGVSIDGDQVTILTPASADWEGKLTYQVVFKKAGSTFLGGYSLSVTLPATGPTVTNIGTVAMASGAEPDSYASQIAEADPTGTVNLSWNGTKWNGDPTETARDQITLTITFEDGTAGGQSYTFTLNDVSVTE